MKGKIISINISKKKGVGKTPIKENASVILKENFGIVGDAHSGTDREVSFLGKSCHSACNIKKLIGDCIMPKEGIFAKVIKGGKIKVRDVVSV